MYSISNLRKSRRLLLHASGMDTTRAFSRNLDYSWSAEKDGSPPPRFAFARASYAAVNDLFYPPMVC